MTEERFKEVLIEEGMSPEDAQRAAELRPSDMTFEELDDFHARYYALVFRTLESNRVNSAVN